MEEEELQERDDEELTVRFQWKWVGISMLLNLLFYFLPIMLVPGGLLSGGPSTAWSIYVVAIWSTVGLFILSAIAAYYSRGVTVWEPVVSSVVLVALVAAAESFHYNEVMVASMSQATDFVVAMFVVFAFSYFGAWWGERQQMLHGLAEYPDDAVVQTDADDGEDPK